MANIIELLTTINECNKEIGNQTFIKNNVKKELDKLMGAFSFSPIKTTIQQAIYDNFTEDYKKLVQEENDKLKEANKVTESWASITDNNNITYGSQSFYISNIFNPFVDIFEIIGFEKTEDNKYRFEVECCKNAKYLGITGNYIPDLYWTIPIDAKDLFVEE